MESKGTLFSAFEDSKHISNVLKVLHSMRPFSKLCDVILKVSGEAIYAHSNVLCAASPYFDALFCGGQDMPRAFSQKSPQIIEIHIDGDEKMGYIEAVRKIVDFMYTGTIEISTGFLSQIVEIAKIMQMENILEFCSEFQQGSTGNVDSSELQRRTSTKDSMVQTDPLDNLNVQSKTLKKFSPDAEKVKAELVKKMTENTKQEKVTPVKRKRGRPRKDGTTSVLPTSKVKIEQEHKIVEIIDEKPKVIELNAPQHEPSVQAIRVSARVRDRILSGKYLGFRGIAEGNDVEKESVDEAVVDEEVLDEKGGKFENESKNSENKDVNENKSRVVYECNICSHVSTTLENFHSHQAAHQVQEKKHCCDVCDFATSKTKEFMKHKRGHMHADNHCSFCGWVCEEAEPNSQIFQEHLAKHVGPEPYFCTVCDLRFKTKTKLQLHTPKHSKIKPFVCDICGAGFKWKHALKNHMIVHKKTKDFLCDFCGFSTAHKSQITAHRLIHTGETFKCTEPRCTFIATKRNYLRYHMLTHTHEKPHQCDQCGQSFSLVKNMKRHMLLHSSTRNFVCEKCSFSTTRFDKLKEHYWKQHNVGAPPRKKFRLKDYLEVKTPADQDAVDDKNVEGTTIKMDKVDVNGVAEIVAGFVESSNLPVEVGQTYELQIQDAGVTDEAHSAVTYFETVDGSTVPLAFRSLGQTNGDSQLTQVQFCDEQTGTLQTLYVTQVEMASDQT